MVRLGSRWFGKYFFARLHRGEENRGLEDMVDVQTACQQACPTNAIVFGNANDKSSKITTTRSEQALRLFHVIEEVHTLPNVSYLAKVRHADVSFNMTEEGKEETAPEKHS